MKKALILLSALSCLFATCKKDAVRTIDSTYNPDVSPARFSNPTNFTNPYWPQEKGKTYFFEGQTEDGLEKSEITRTDEIKVILGISCAVIRDRVWLNGTLIEDTYDWHAQDNDGNVWYFGESVKNYNTNGSFKNNAGSWEAGVDGAKPGIIMLANPVAGNKYREEYYFNSAEDQAEVAALGESVTTPYGAFNNCLKTRNFTELEPDAVEFKWYAPGIGVVKELDGAEEIKLVDIR